jgi:hypothetical protein
MLIGEYISVVESFLSKRKNIYGSLRYECLHLNKQGCFNTLYSARQPFNKFEVLPTKKK